MRVRLVLVLAALTACAGDAAPAPRPASTADVSGITPAFGAIDEALAEISPAQVRADIDRLVSFGTRHTLSATEGDRGIGAARRWLKEEFERIAAASGRTGADAMRVRFDVHRQGRAVRIPREVEIVNVEAVLPGAMPAATARRYYLVAHYDSRASDPMDAEKDAPGANDDGSGVAALLSAARVLSKRRFDATIVLLAVAGEEQGLYGSRLHAGGEKSAGHDVAGVLSNDIVGDPTAPDGRSARDEIRVFSEGIPRAATTDEIRTIASLGGESDSPSRQLARYVAEIAALHGTRVRPRLVFRADRFLRGGDHTGFNEQGFPAVRFTDVFETYDRQHQDVRVEETRDVSGKLVSARRYGDTAEFVDAEYLADVSRLDTAVLAHLANAPAPPKDVRILTAELTTDTTLRWSRSPETDVTGYEIVWRRTTAATWEHAQVAGAVTEFTLPVSKDEHLFGVRAFDRDGHWSVATFAGAAKE
jgi:hypothetical protein